MTEKEHKQARLIEGGLILLAGALAADDPKRELQTRVGDLISDVRALTGRQR